MLAAEQSTFFLLASSGTAQQRDLLVVQTLPAVSCPVPFCSAAKTLLGELSFSETVALAYALCKASRGLSLPIL